MSRLIVVIGDGLEEINQAATHCRSSIHILKTPHSKVDVPPASTIYWYVSFRAQSFRESMRSLKLRFSIHDECNLYCGIEQLVRTSHHRFSLAPATIMMSRQNWRHAIETNHHYCDNSISLSVPLKHLLLSPLLPPNTHQQLLVLAKGNSPLIISTCIN